MPRGRSHDVVLGPDLPGRLAALARLHDLPFERLVVVAGMFRVGHRRPPIPCHSSLIGLSNTLWPIQTLPAQGAERRGGADRHVPGRRVHPTGRRHQPAAVERPHVLADALRQAQEGVRRDRRMAQPPVGGSEYPYVFMDGVWHKRSWGGSVENVSILVAIGVDREVIGVTEGMKEDRASWEQFVRDMIGRGLEGVRLVVGDR